MPEVEWSVRAVRDSQVSSGNGRQTILLVLEGPEGEQVDAGDVITTVRPTPCPLTPNQLRCVQGLAEGKPYTEIAADRGRSVSTIRTQLNGAYKRAGIPGDRAQIVLLARREGWI